MSTPRIEGDRPRRHHWRGMAWNLPINLSVLMRGWIARSHRRRTLGRLTELNDHLLKDIGLSRDTALREAAKWFWQR